ncbi:ATP-dependent DNA helicase, RecQ family [Gaiella occulta]|uniref:ATP-dependent DNA helicase RecQ n=1 Tax=Gaiella occulta TaxID=1002870 RepID=A0A7M2YYX5_9ACTN|nr:ATP-dependent DNA helicase RecQ [Gaiella occulta]RDI75290.1 ATP-dependent DNA helicase, RecQ family [Gaiella occulta]
MPDLAPQLRRLFGFDAFRPGQEAVVRAAVEGRDTLALMPTGSGKSLTYQLAAMLRPEPTLVLSPLIALMKDQVDKLPPEIAATATFVNSSLEPGEAAARIDGVASGRTRLLYAAPERLRSGAFVEMLRRIGVGLVVIDEVHCVSMWGHDFRPDYLFIRRALAEFGEPAVLGMTATATPATAREIAAALGRELEVVRTSVVRTNLRYDVAEVSGNEDRLRVLVERIGRLEGGSTIVYARSRDSCERIARTLRGHGLRLEHYHAGLEAAERTRVQDDFLAGRIQGVVATTAFGMGIDKPDVRLVCLVNYPDSLESYVQQVGRAGRDGRPSDTLLLASPSDATAVRRFAVSDIPGPDDLRRVYRALRERGGIAEPETLATAIGGDHDPRVLVGMLEQAGIVRRGYDSGRAMRVELLPAGDGAGATLDALLERYAREAEARVERIVAFAESRRCRHRQVAEHFGETLEAPCGACDVCDPPSASRARPPATPLPSDVATAIVRAVESLAWPVGRRSLVAMLRGSVTAPRSARGSLSFGILARASEAEVKRWIGALETAGALLEIETKDGYRVLKAIPGVPLPVIGPKASSPADDATVERLREWRRERSRADGVPAYVVLSDATLREIAAARPASRAELAGVKGFGPAKLERYGDAVLGLVAASS